VSRINTKEKLITYIRSMLGEPIIKVELTDIQMEYIIDEVILKFSEFAYDGQDIRHIIVPIFDSIKEYKLDNRISSIIKLQVTNKAIAAFGSIGEDYTINETSVTEMLNIENIETSMAKVSKFNYLFDITPNYTFNSNNKALVEVALEYEPEEVDLIFNHSWIKDMCVARCKYQWGNNIGKYSGTLINGNTINYSDIKSEGLSDIERLNEELLSRWSPPLGVIVG
jgi:hypothetical protein